MLLRRIIEHVKAQNWTAVALDFFIVVVGVFMGIQLGNWNEARAERDRLSEQLDSFRTELIMARDDFDAREDYYEARVAAAAELRNSLDGEGAALTEDTFNRLANSALRSGPLGITFRNFDELSASGNLSLISDNTLLDLIYLWDKQLTRTKFIDDSTDEFRTTTILRAYSSNTVLGNVMSNHESFQELTKTDRFQFDAERVKASLEFDNAVALAYVLAMQQLTFLREFRATTENLIDALGPLTE